MYSFIQACDSVRQHPVLARLHANNGYPPDWRRKHGFQSLVKTILEQQVSLASAQAAFHRLQNHLGNLQAKTILALQPEHIQAIGITRPKTRYLFMLAKRVQQDPCFFERLTYLPDQQAHRYLQESPGIGPWTSAVYLLLALQRYDCYPHRDIALLRSVVFESGIQKLSDPAEALAWFEPFKPFRGIACFYFYHAYLIRRHQTFTP